MSEQSRPVTVLTGATGGLGTALAHALAHHDLWLLGRDPQKLSELCAALPHARGVLLELRQPENFATVLKDIHPIDNLVHLAGEVHLGRVDETPLEVWRTLWEVNVLAAVELTRICLPSLRSSGGQVLFVNSTAGLQAYADWSAYSASKFALKAYSDALRLEEPRLRVQSVFPGRIATPMQQRVRVQEGQPYEPERYIRPDTLAQTLRHLLESPRDSVHQLIVERPG